jgi:hypothetical protein
MTEAESPMPPVKGGYHRAMKIATFNVNNINKRLTKLVDWLGTARPDVACLQELKATDSEVPFAPIKQSGYSGVWRGGKVMEWGGHPRAWDRAHRHEQRAARRYFRRARPLYRSSRRRRAYCQPLCAQRQPTAWSEIHLQACLDGAVNGARGRAL